jgi:hypothetical protein
MRFVATKTAEQLVLQALHRVRSRLVDERTAIADAIRGLLLDRRSGVAKGTRLQRLARPSAETNLDRRSHHPLQDLQARRPVPEDALRASRPPRAAAAPRQGLKPWIEAATKRLHHNGLAIALTSNLARIARRVLHHGRSFEVRKISEPERVAVLSLQNGQMP